MSGEQWERIKEIYARASDLPDAERRALLERECTGEPDLLAEIQELLANAEGPSLLVDSSRILGEVLAGDYPAPPPPSTEPWKAGEMLGPYQILAPIGKGGMGEVYRALDLRMDRQVAIKRVPERLSGRFVREVRAIAALNHPNICIVHDVGPNYLVMEYVDGAPLRGPIPEANAIELARQIAAGLETAHAKGIIHRDLKPANILRTTGGVKLCDFGIATLIRPVASDSLEKPALAAGVSFPDSMPGDVTATLITSESGTALGETIGTPAYMSPEQAAGQAVDGRSDIFSFGSVLYEVLTGRRAFQADTARDTMIAVQREDPEPFEASPEVVRIVNRCLRKNASERFQTAAELREALEKAAAAVSRKAPCVAVLPFVMAGADPENEYFSDGLTEDIINALSSVAGLKVIARTSTFAFKHQARDIREIADTLGANHVMEGSVRRAGDRIRITTRLIAARDGTQLWANRYDRDLRDIFLVQDEISHAIATELRVSLTTQRLVKPPTEHFAAYEEILRGRHYFYRFDPEDQARALASFEKAAAIDPEYAAAHIGIALYHWGQMIVGMENPRESMRICVAKAREALRFDPGSSEAHHVIGACLAINDFEWAESEQYLKRALQLNPNSFDAMHCYTHYCLGPLARWEDALRVQEQALSLDPLSPHMNCIHSIILDGLGRHETEAEVLEHVNRLDPGFVAGQWLLVSLRVRQQRIAEALELAEAAIRRGGRWAMTLGTLGIAHAAAGHQDLANDVIQELGSAPGAESRAFWASLIAAAMGDSGEAFRWAAQSIENRDSLMPIILRSSSFAALRSDPRYAGLLRLLRMEK